MKAILLADRHISFWLKDSRGSLRKILGRILIGLAWITCPSQPVALSFYHWFTGSQAHTDYQLTPEPR